MIPGDTYGILNRLLLNQPIEPSPEGIFRILGFVHLYTASGLHLIALEVFLQRIFGRTLAMKKILTVLFLFFLILIWKLQGFRLGFARVLVLFFLRSLARAKGYRWRVYYPLLLAFCFDFAVGIDSGWQHYYLAILGGMLGVEFAQNRGMLLQHLYLSLASWLMTAPLDLWQHHTISWMTPIWSMITIPIIAIFLYPLSVISYILFERVPEGLINLWNEGIQFLLALVDHGFTFSVVNNRYFLISLLFAMVMSILFFFVKSIRNRCFLIVAVVLILISIEIKPEALKLVQLDVGQGDSLLLEKNERVEMIDLGTSRGVKPETVLLHLAQYGETRINTVLFSHFDEDHSGGVRLLLPWVPTEHLEANSRLERASKLQEWLKDFPKTTWCSSSCFQLGKVDWIRSQGHSSGSGNELMASVIIPLNKREVYLALGDSDSSQEELFWQRHQTELVDYPRRILKISHHGSKNSSNDDFLEKINPSRAIISVGLHNRYHHPHFLVLNRLMKDHIPIHRTDRDGDYIF